MIIDNDKCWLILINNDPWCSMILDTNQWWLVIFNDSYLVIVLNDNNSSLAQSTMMKSVMLLAKLLRMRENQKVVGKSTKGNTKVIQNVQQAPSPCSGLTHSTIVVRTRQSQKKLNTGQRFFVRLNHFAKYQGTSNSEEKTRGLLF